MKPLLALLCLTSIVVADTNVIITPSVTTDKLDMLNADMNERYKLTIKPDKSKLTGYMIQDPLTKLVRTYSVLHIEF
jgi:hypothetical protein